MGLPGSPNFLVYKPGGVEENNVYVDWSNLIATFSTIEGPVWIELDDSLGALTIPTGTWDLEGRAHLVSSYGTERTSVRLGSGSILQNVSSFERVYVYSDAAETGKIQIAADSITYATDCEFTTFSDTNALIESILPHTFVLINSQLTSAGAAFPVCTPISTSGDQQTILLQGVQSSVGDDVFGGSTTIDVYRQTSWVTCSDAHAAFTGTLNVNSPAETPQMTFVFRPGGIDAGNVYTDWTMLMAAVGVVTGPKIIEFDASLDGNLRCDIPTGTWNLGGETILRGKPRASGGDTLSSNVLMADGAIFQNALELDGFLSVYSSSTSEVFTWSGDARRLVLRGRSFISGAQLGLAAAPTSPLINASTVGVSLELYDRSGLGSSSGDENVLYALSGADCVVDAHDQSVIGDASASVGSVGVPLNTDGAATIRVNIYDQSVRFYQTGYVGISWTPYCVRQYVVSLTKGLEVNPTVTPAAIGAAYVSYQQIPKHENMKCKFRVVMETASGSMGYEAYIDLFDVYGQLSSGIPSTIAGSQMDTASSSSPEGSPAANSLIPSAYEVDVTSAIVDGIWVSDGLVLEARLWVGTSAGGNAATCKSAELVFEWAELA
jgi:hypothetical protein